MKEETSLQPELEPTNNIYGLPIPDGTSVTHLTYESESHSGPFRGAVDIRVNIGTSILAPLAGKVVRVIDSHNQYGNTKDFIPFSNIIDLEHANGEISELVHLAKGSASVRVGDQVEEGQEIAKTGLSGWMSGPHLHWLVFIKIPEKPRFKGLKIQLKKPLEELLEK